MIYIFTIYLKIYMINFTFTYLHGYHSSSEGHHIYMLTCLQIYMANFHTYMINHCCKNLQTCDICDSNQPITHFLQSGRL